MICIFRLGGFSATDNNTILLFQKADSLFAHNKFQEAGIVYDYIAYLSGDNVIRSKALIKKADCYLERKEFSQSSNVLSRIFYSGLNDSISSEARYKSALASYLNGDFSEAESHLLQAKTFIRDSSLTYAMYPLYIMVLNELHQYKEAALACKNYITYSIHDSLQKESLLKQIEIMYQASKVPQLKSPEKAKNLSMFLPGMGQLYAGYFWEGALNVGLQLVGLGFTGVCIWQQYYFTGGLIGFSIFQKFYTGGMTRAVFLVEKKNYLITQKFNRTVKDFLLTKSNFTQKM